MREKNKKFLLYIFSFVYLILILCMITSKIVLAKDTKDSKEEYKKEKVIYLTFDDGPSYIVSDKILDILKESNVKATFFVVGSKIKGRENILKRMYDEGHSIGLHSFSHKYNQIYSSYDNFIKEMDDTAEEVNRVLGFRPNIIRFPGGSKPFLNSELLDRLHKKNYKIYDWNASLSDGLNYNTPVNKLIMESHNVVGKSYSRIFLLLHCDQVNKNTAIALPEIIDYYKNLGYKFKAITDETSEYYFRFK
jgi:peptidoglycan/xylan/chitin deacetylase (PgdA/CDA1 family)